MEVELDRIRVFRSIHAIHPERSIDFAEGVADVGLRDGAVAVDVLEDVEVVIEEPEHRILDVVEDLVARAAELLGEPSE